MNSGLTGKTVVVTGGSGGIGQSIVSAMVAEGANVMIHFNTGRERAEALADKLPRSEVELGAADLTSESEVAQLFQSAANRFGKIDILIANAGKWPQPDTPIHEMSLERWNDTIAVNSTSVFLCVREFLKHALSAGITDPAIVATGSTAGRVGEAGHADYGTAKAGFMYGMVQSLKNEITRVAPLGRINAVCPGWTITPMARSLTADEAAMKKTLQTIPMRKFASSDDIASAVTFLASNKLAGHITGQTLFVDGGMEGRVINDPDEIVVEDALPKYTPL